jgi:hypothetical protein
MSATNEDCSPAPCSPKFVVEFGKHKGKTLEQIAEQDNAYILWLDQENVLNIEQEFLEAGFTAEEIIAMKRTEVF